MVDARVAIARIAAEESERFIAKAFRLEITKAIDPTTPGGFMAITTRFARELSKEANKFERPAILRAVQRLDVDWANLTPEQRTAAVRAANKALLPIEQKVPPAVQTTIGYQAETMIQGSKKAIVREYGLKIGSSLTETDQEVARVTAVNQSNFVRDEYGRRRAEFSTRAREIVAEGLSKGLGRTDIAEDLSKKLGEHGLMRSDPYWRLIASTFANRSRTHTTLGAFDQAGIDRYQFEAVLDEHTTEICRFLHGRVFSTSRGLGMLSQIEEGSDPEDVRNVTPWVRSGSDGDHDVLFFQRGEERVSIARVDRSGYGRADDIGEFSHGMKDHELEASGVTMPPVHAFCRSTVVALEGASSGLAPSSSTPNSEDEGAPERSPEPTSEDSLHPALVSDEAPEQESINVKAKAEDALKAFGLSKEDVASLSGMSNGKVEIGMIDYGEHGKALEIEAKRSMEGGGSVYMNRTLSKEKGGKLVLHNELFEIYGAGEERQGRKLGTGVGAKLFSQQVANARRLGVDRIETSAARSKNFNGYYTWGRFGYDGTFSADRAGRYALDWEENAPFRKMMAETGYTKVSEFMATEKGRELWKEYGHSFNGTFDLSDDSYSMRTLDTYLREKSKKPK